MGLFGNRTLNYDINDDSAYDLAINKSTAIENARYDGNDIHIKFVNGNKEYTYPNIPKEVADNFKNATSYGKAFNNDIKPYSVK